MPASAERVQLFKNFDRLHCQCRACKHVFQVFRQEFNPEDPITCPSCNSNDNESWGEGLCPIVVFNSAPAVQRWRELWLNQEGRFPGAYNPRQHLQLPLWFFDFVMPKLTRWEFLVSVVLARFRDQDGWSRIGQRAMAYRLSQYKPGEGIHAPARQNVSRALLGLSEIYLEYDLGEGRDLQHKLLKTDRGKGRASKYKLDVEPVPGGTLKLAYRKNEITG